MVVEGEYIGGGDQGEGGGDDEIPELEDVPVGEDVAQILDPHVIRG